MIESTTMEALFLPIQVVISVLIIVLVLLQGKGGGLTAQVGSFHTRRGAERFIFRSTVVLSVAFIGLALLAMTLA